MGVRYQIYDRFGQMPPETLRECRRMGMLYGGVLRNLVSNYLEGGERYMPLDKAIIMRVDGRIVGWGVTFFDYYTEGDLEYHMWIKCRERGKGYGTKLLAKAIKMNETGIIPHTYGWVRDRSFNTHRWF